MIKLEAADLETGFGKEAAAVLRMLQTELNRRNVFPGKSSWFAGTDWQGAADLAERHGVLPLLQDSFLQNPEIPAAVRMRAEKEAQRTALQSYRLLFLSRYLTERLTEAGIQSVVLKGVTASAPYPVPELRKSGDVDLLLLEPDRIKEACRVLEQGGCIQKTEQIARHHIVFAQDEISIELHTMLAEPFDNSRINGYMQRQLPECRSQTVLAEIMGICVPMLAPAYQAYELLLHMLQHYLRAGFGLKLLCDWAVFWNQEQPEEERRNYQRLVQESGLKGFSDTVTLACCQYLGLSRESVQWMELSDREAVAEGLMADILEGGEFGASSGDRMVSLRNTGKKEYIREFHHQMCLNFPQGSRCILCWPALSIVTLYRFLRNNHRLRNVSVWAVFRKAGQRSRLNEQMELWK